MTEEKKETYQELHNTYLFRHEDEEMRKKKIFPMKPEKARLVMAAEKPTSYTFVTIHVKNYFWIQLDMPGDGAYSQENELGSLNFTMLESKQIPSGMPFLVKIFNKINDMEEDDTTYDGDKVDMKELETSIDTDESKTEDKPKKMKTPKTISFSQLRAIQQEDGKVVFESVGEVTARVKVPDGMLRFIPVSMKRMEKMGSGTITKMLEKGTKDTTNAIEKIYGEWLKKHDA